MEDDLMSLIKCDHCKQVYEDPVILPCYISLCLKHLINEKIYKCFNCNQDHIQPEKSFPIDKKTIKLMQVNKQYIKAEQINFGVNHKKANDSLDNLELLINENDLTQLDSMAYIDDFFNKIRNKIDSTKEQQIKLIKENHKRISKQLDKFEKECKTNSEAKTETFSRSVKQTRSNLKKWRKSLQTADFTKNSEWNMINIRAEQETEKLKILKMNFQNDLLLNQDCEFIANTFFNENNFGDLLIADKEVLDSTRSEGTIQWTINDFTNFKNSRLKRQSKEWFIVKNISWKVSAYVHEIDLKLYLALLVYSNSDDESFKINPVKAFVTLRIIPYENQFKRRVVLFEKTFEKHFVNNLGFGFKDFILLSELFDEENEIFNKEDDLVIIEATVKIIH